jgi:hypothetical protein
MQRARPTSKLGILFLLLLVGALVLAVVEKGCLQGKSSQVQICGLSDRLIACVLAGLSKRPAGAPANLMPIEDSGAR